MIIRLATLFDADEGCTVSQRSIVELCGADHSSDPDEIASWTANKTPETWRHWLGNPALRVFVAVRAGRIAGVGLVGRGGEILLNYVSPDARFQGVSKSLLARMEEETGANGNEYCTLVSTRTAERFYTGEGYVEEGRTSEGHLRLRKQVLR